MGRKVVAQVSFVPFDEVLFLTLTAPIDFRSMSHS